MTFAKTISLAVAAALALPAAASAQEQDSDVSEYRNYRYVLGANQTCELFNQPQIIAANFLAGDVKSRLKRRGASDDDLEKIDAYEQGVSVGTGCPSREDQPALWARVDNVRSVTNAFIMAPSYMKTDPEGCSANGLKKMPRKEWDHLANAIKNKIDDPAIQSSVISFAQRIASNLDEDCPRPVFGRAGTSRLMRPALSYINLLEDANDAMQKKIGVSKSNWNNLYSMGSSFGGDFEEDGFWRSRKSFTALPDDKFIDVIGLRGSDETVAAATIRLRLDGTYSPQGTFYVDRKANFKAHIRYGVSGLKIVASDGQEFIFDRTMRTEGNTFLGKTRFALPQQSRDALFKLEPETEIRFFLREKDDGAWKLYSRSNGKDSTVLVGWIGQAYQWGTKPSALSR